MRDRIREAINAAGFGPLCEAGPGGPGAPSGDPAPAGTGTGAPAGGGGGGAPAAGDGDRSNWIPRERFDEINRERETLRQEKDERERKDLEAKGEHQKLAETERTKREAAEARATNIARRAAFIAAAAGKVVDAEAAYTLAAAELSDLAVDDDGRPKDVKAAEKIVDDLVKRYPFLKSDNKTRSFGDDRSGTGGGSPALDPAKASARELLSAGYGALPDPRRRS